jgi:hypothetical protein
MKNKTAWIVGGLAVAGVIYYISRKNTVQVQVLPAAPGTTTPAATTPIATTNPAVNTGIVPPSAPAASSGLKPGPGVQPKEVIVKPTPVKLKTLYL